ncbi:tyrosine-type recombinase/integrase [Streptomyces sp. NPDC007984]|uniref:tyrosine-type recombinase/integrase n=1 Tax=Streptomyces sp. NPDC007984 TaxID=3364801 RepID=UPI0036E3E77F
MDPDPYEVLDDWLRRAPLQPGSREAYRAEVNAWLVHIGARVWSAAREDVDAWSGAGTKLRTKARRVSSVRGFYNHAQTYDAFIDNPAERELRPHVSHLPPGRPALDDAQAVLFLSALDHYRGPLPLRTRALGYLILGMNLRAHQAVAIDLSDWIRDERISARIRLKGGRVETRAVPPRVAAAVDDYLPHRRVAAPHSFPATGPLLTSSRGRRLDSRTSPTSLMRAVAAGHPLLVGIAATVTSDGLAATHSPLAGASA